MKFAITMLAIVSCWFSVESVVAGGPLKKTADYYEALQKQYIDKQVEIYVVEIKRSHGDTTEGVSWFEAYSSYRGEDGGWISIAVPVADTQFFVKFYGLDGKFQHDSADWRTKYLNGILRKSGGGDGLYILYRRPGSSGGLPSSAVNKKSGLGKGHDLI